MNNILDYVIKTYNSKLFCTKNKIIYFLIIFITSRFIIYNNFIDNITINFDLDYKTALNENFLEYLIFYHSLPIGNIILAKNYLYLSNYIEAKTFYYVLNCIYSLLSFFLIFKIYSEIYKKIGIINYILLIIFSVAISQYETWRIDHHDHINLFLFTYLIYFFYNYIFKNNIESTTLVSIFLLFALFYSGSLIILIETMAIIIILNMINKKSFDKKLIFYLIIFIIFNGIIILKNFYNLKIIAPTSVMNSVLLQRIHHALGDEKYKINLEKTKLPGYQKECINEIYLNKQNAKNHFEELTLYKCYQNKNKYNYIKIINKLRDFNVEEKLIDQIKKDKNDTENKLWKLSGGYKEYNERTSHIFNTETKKIFFNSIINYPYETIIGKIGSKGFILTFIQTSYWGAVLPNYYEKYNKINNSIYKVLNLILAILNIFFVFYFLFFLVKELLIKKNFKILKKKLFQLNLIILLLIFFFIFINSIITCCENPRMMVMIYFLFVINTLINSKKIIDLYLINKSLIKIF